MRRTEDMMALRALSHTRGAIAFGALVLAAACNSEVTIEETIPLSANTSGKGIVEATSRHSPSEATEALRQALQEASLAIPVDLSHSDAATAAQLELPPSQLLMFSNPTLGTPFMQENALVALDLPLKMLVFEAADGTTHVAYDAPDYLRRRHALTMADGGLQMAADALARLATTATGGPVFSSMGDAGRVSPGEGLVTHTSAQDAEGTLAALVRAIEGNAELRVVTRIDHRDAADNAGLDLGFATVVVFGNAAVGTPLIESAPTTGLDLPLKVLVAEVGDEVVVAYSSVDFLVTRHTGLDGLPQLDDIESLLDSLARAAAGN